MFVRFKVLLGSYSWIFHGPIILLASSTISARDSKSIVNKYYHSKGQLFPFSKLYIYFDFRHDYQVLRVSKSLNLYLTELY